MCGRYTINVTLEELMQIFLVEQSNYPLKPNYNVAPTQTVPVILQEEGKRVLEGFHWGLVPFWAKDKKVGFKMINARAETVAEKPAFGRLLKSQRVIIPADGFYEWRKDGKEKQPFRFQLKDKSTFGFAGLWDEWTQPNGEKLRSCTIITTTPNAFVEDVHDRMPVILERDTVEAWLDPQTNKELLQNFLVPYPADKMIRYPVSKDVGNVKNNGADLLEEVALNSK
ncbi:Putative SOS response-associated peptidase YedK [Paenibacillus sp. UNC496MF]|uniref:SOS response-associated peptidase n=1 Tax=Paenibacillus sp. UNC496MF TaxID=1502753 RepID=UPI0008EE9209|nr:SOS response-associated peptidase [Paenibacillus sp. UNC496MF]SFJ76914.1 Putative SOS response-associated peptidase YedK [Paenibacillus sp. UNC496MF]